MGAVDPNSPFNCARGDKTGLNMVGLAQGHTVGVTWSVQNFFWWTSMAPLRAWRIQGYPKVYLHLSNTAGAKKH